MTTSALVHMTDTPELFGGELRILAALDFVDGKVVRWIDYWDGASFDGDLYAEFRTPAEAFPTDLRHEQVGSNAAPEIVQAATALQAAFAAGDASAAAALMHTDVVFEDRALRAQIVGRIETTRYLERILGQVPYGRRASSGTSSGAAPAVASSGRQAPSTTRWSASPRSSSTPTGSS